MMGKDLGDASAKVVIEGVDVVQRLHPPGGRAGDRRVAEPLGPVPSPGEFGSGLGVSGLTGVSCPRSEPSSWKHQAGVGLELHCARQGSLNGTRGAGSAAHQACQPSRPSSRAAWAGAGEQNKPSLQESEHGVREA